jgi:hypothetical protein
VKGDILQTPEDMRIKYGNVVVVIQENRVNVFVTLDGGAVVSTTINSDRKGTGKVETQG